MDPPPVVRGRPDGRGRLLVGGIEIAEAEQRLGHLYVDQPGLYVPGLVGLRTGPDPLGGRLGVPDAAQCGGGVAELGVRLGLHGVQVGGQGRGGVPACGPQRGLGEGDGLAVLPQVQRLVDDQRDDVGAEPPVPARLREPQRLVEVPLGEPVGVRVVRADPGHRHQGPGGPVQLAAEAVGVAPAQHGRGLAAEEADNPGPGDHAAGPAVHQLVVRAGGPQDLDVLRPDPVRPVAGDVGVLGRVLPLPDRDHGGRSGDGLGGEQLEPALLVGTPQGGGPVDEAAERGAVRGHGLARHPEPDVVQRHRAPEPAAEHFADQVGHLAARPLPPQPPGDGGVFVAQGQSAGPACLVHVCCESGVGHPRLGEEGVEQGIGLHGPLQGLFGLRLVGARFTRGANLVRA